uniref:Aminopeptidase N-like N-terminal domain-containing protein n=1 Tax=Panagrolaimus sp. JU765 TaxID=591449 RepID=A0AC34R3V2_9BILA
MYVPGYVPLPPGKDFTSEAELTTKFNVRKATNIIELNSLNLELPTNPDDYYLSSKEPTTTSKIRRIARSHPSSQTRITKITMDETLQKVFFELEKPLETGKSYFFKFGYSGKISEQLSGLYRTTYWDLEGKIHYAALTDFEPTDARRMVPCFDEPAFKAVWKVQVYHPKGTRAISNAIEVVENQIDK